MVRFYPSHIEDSIYEILEEPEYIVGVDVFTQDAIRAVEDFLEIQESSNPAFQWNEISVNKADYTGAYHSFCWIENGNLSHIVLESAYNY